MQTLSMAGSPSHFNHQSASSGASEDPIIKAKAAELMAKERAVEAGLQAIEDMRKRLEADRTAVDRQMARMQELGMKVREDSQRLAEQARALRSLALNAAPASPGKHNAAEDGAFQPRSPVSRGAASAAEASGSASGSGGGELFDPEVVSLFEKYKKPLLALWSFYSGLSGGAASEASGIDCKRFLELFGDYDISPTFITRRELKSIFVAAAKAHGTLQSAGGAGSPGAASEAGGAASSEIRGHLAYAGLIETLGRAALASLSKPAFAHLYPTAKDRVMVLLEMWGVADSRKLAEMQRRPRKHHAGATATMAASGGDGVSGLSTTA
jgi:hypothetical protein